MVAKGGKVRESLVASGSALMVLLAGCATADLSVDSAARNRRGARHRDGNIAPPLVTSESLPPVDGGRDQLFRRPLMSGAICSGVVFGA